MAIRKPSTRLSVSGREVMMGSKTGGPLVAVALMLLASTAVAQQGNNPAPAAAPPAALPPGSPLIGRPEGNAAAAKLAPVPAPPLAAAADKVPVGQLKAP